MNYWTLDFGWYGITLDQHPYGHSQSTGRWYWFYTNTVSPHGDTLEFKLRNWIVIS